MVWFKSVGCHLPNCLLCSKLVFCSSKEVVVCRTPYCWLPCFEVFDTSALVYFPQSCEQEYPQEQQDGGVWGVSITE